MRADGEVVAHGGGNMRCASDQSAERPRYAIVIPTRNRQRYAVDAAQTALTAAAETEFGVEIILADASDDAAELADRICDTGLADQVSVLAPDPSAATMQGNWERGLAATTADYVIFIGDDDGLVPDALDTIDAMIEAAPAPVYAWEPADYRWPCFPTEGRGRLSTTLAAPSIAIERASDGLNRHYNWATRSKWPDIGPSIYHGAVRRDLIDCVRRRQGAYFSSFVVDYASAISNAAHMDAYVHLSAPLTVLGACGQSNSAALTGGKVSAARRAETQSDTPHLTPIFEDLADAGLWAPLVARGYSLSFAKLGLSFEPQPARILASCVAELGFLTCGKQFEQARSELVAFAQRRNLDAAAALGAKFIEDGLLTGAPNGKGKYFVDTMALGWTGIVDAAAQLRAFAPGLGATPQERRTALAPVAAHFRKLATAA